jgi:hypothetical protein
MLHMRHVAQYGEDDEPCQETGKTVDAARDDRIPVGQNSALLHPFSKLQRVLRRVLRINDLN